MNAEDKIWGHPWLLKFSVFYGREGLLENNLLSLFPSGKFLFEFRNFFRHIRMGQTVLGLDRN